MMIKRNDKNPSRAVAEALQKYPGPVTVADITARTGLPLALVQEALPRAADEYGAGLAVTESGEICYSFPRILKSRRRGARVWLRGAAERAFRRIKRAAAALFKVWIMGMLVGYFALFMLIALAALVLSLAASASRRDSGEHGEGGRGIFFAAGIFDLIIRLWFYSEAAKALGPYDRGGASLREQARGNRAKKPLHKGVFSFVFGEGDPDKDWPVQEKQGVMAYLKAHNGVISLPEFMFLTGRPPSEAEGLALSYCAQFGGMPEATAEGTLVYRFDQLLKQAAPAQEAEGMPLRRLSAFSSNPKNMNIWFCVLNGVNALFGGYFLFSAGAPDPSFLYLVAGALASLVTPDTRFILSAGLGAFPLIFSLLFWIIPAARYGLLKKRNQAVARENQRKQGYRAIWDSPLAAGAEGAAAGPAVSIIKEMGAYAPPEAAIDSQGKTVYAFRELEREKEALRAYRSNIDPRSSDLGGIIFDTT
ncbi:MAG: hypothetical protein LBD13_05205 [Spirochaetaceae bacterium]|jgi:hypothetical protein|nr:hypothetical protein [Spirochaetaceae bacterium]